MALAELDALSRGVAEVSLDGVRDRYAHAVRKLRARGVPLTDRRIVKGQTLVAAAALMAGRGAATAADLWPAVYLVQDAALQGEVRDLLAADLADSESPVLAEAVRGASFGPRARAAELAARGDALLDASPAAPGGEAAESWLVRAESFLAQVDAGFAPDRLPPDLARARHSLAERCTALWRPAAAGPAAAP